MPTRRSESGPGKRKKPAAAKKAPAKKPKAAPSAPKKKRQRGSSAAEERRVHTPEVAGSTPAPASTNTVGQLMAARPVAGPRTPDAPLSMQEEAFVSEYLRNGENGTAAWIFVHPGTSPSVAAVRAHQTLRRAKVAERMAAERARLQQKFEIDRDSLLQRFLAIAEADPNELTQMRHLACGHCWNGNRGPAMYVDPDPECESCSGEGVAMPWIADTRRLSPAARALFAGIKQTKDGVQVLMHDKVAALVNVAKIIGAFEEDNRQKGSGLTDAVREFFAGLQDRRLPIKREQPTAQHPPAQAHPLVSGPAS